MKNKLAMFDLDGTLICTKFANYHAYKSAFKKYGFMLEQEFFENECFGKSYKEFGPIIMNENLEHFSDIHTLKKEIYKNFFDKSSLNIHLLNIIEQIKDDYYLVVVTTASKQNALEILNHHNILDKFDSVITADDVNEIKPNPEGYNKAIKEFGISKENTIIFEDSEVGIEAAKKTGATVFVVDQFSN